MRYALGWLAGGAVVAALLVGIIGGEDEVTLPPIEETQLEVAARTARCDLRHARAGEIVDPPVGGPRRAPPLGPGIYDEPARPDAVVAALREGAVVVQYDPGLDDTGVEQLEDIQLAIPEGTIVLPGDTAMHYEVAMTAWHRLLGCTELSESAIDALRLFHGRFIGRGPDLP